MTLAAPLSAALLVFAAAAPAKEPPMLRFGTDVKPTPSDSPPAGDDPAPLKVGAPTVKVEGGKVLGELVVENPTDKALRVTVNPYGGSFPYGGTSPFTLGFGGEPAVKYSGELFPPEPPRPLAIEFPAKARVLFTADVTLKDYTWAGAPEVGLTWGFYFAKGKPVEGTVKVRLPKK